MNFAVAAHSKTMSQALRRCKQAIATKLMHQLEEEFEIEAGPTLDRLMQ